MIFMQFPSVAETQVQTTCDPDMEKRIRARQRMLFDKLQSICYRTKLPCICPKDDSYHENEAEMTIFLRKVIGAVSFGNPKNKATDENHFTGFDVEQLKSIDKVFECLKSIKDSGGNGVEIAVIVIILIEEDKVTEVPIFRVKVSSEQDTPNHFVDVSARCYKSFEELLLKNDFPSAQFCYPQDGIYSLDGDEVKVFIDDNPAAKERGAVARLSEYAKPIVYASAAALNTLTGYWNKEVAVRLPRSSGLREGFPFLMTPGTLPSAVPIVTNPLETIRKMTQLMVLSLANEVGLSVEMLEALALVWKPYVLSKIKSLLLLQAFSSVEEMLTNLKTLLEGSLKYGPNLYSIFEISTSLFVIKDVEEAKNCFSELLQFLCVSYAALRYTSNYLTEAQILADIVDDENLLAQLLACFESKEENYHSCDQPSRSGNLSAETYNLILQKFLRDEYSHVILRNTGSAPGHFLVDKKGLIRITEYINRKVFNVRMWHRKVPM